MRPWNIGSYPEPCHLERSPEAASRLTLKLLTLEIAATLLLLGAQVIAEYERMAQSDAGQPAVALRTDT